MDEENFELEAASESSDNSVSLDIALDDQPKEVPFKGLVSDRPFNLEQKQEETCSYIAFAKSVGLFLLNFKFVGIPKRSAEGRELDSFNAIADSSQREGIYQINKW